MIEAEKNIIRFIAMFGAAVCVLILTITWYRNSGEKIALSQLIDCCWTTLCLSLPKFNFLKASVVSEPTVAKQTWWSNTFIDLAKTFDTVTQTVLEESWIHHRSQSSSAWCSKKSGETWRKMTANTFVYALMGVCSTWNVYKDKRKP